MPLGRGLASLIPKKESDLLKFKKGDFSSSSGTGESVFYVEIDKVKPNPHQPRKDFTEEALQELADSIKEYGIIQPLVVTKIERMSESGRSVDYQLIAGERRLRAAEIVGLTQVPVVIRKASEEEKLAIALIENVQRHDLNAMEKANAFRKLVEKFNLSHKDIAQKISKSREAVSNSLRLLALPMEIQRAVSGGKISEGHARAILSLENLEKQRALFHEIVEKNLTVRQTEELAKSAKPLAERVKRKIENDPEVREWETKLQEVLGTKARIHKKGESGKIVIEFYGSEELQKFLEKMGIEN